MKKLGLETESEIIYLPEKEPRVYTTTGFDRLAIAVSKLIELTTEIAQSIYGHPSDQFPALLRINALIELQNEIQELLPKNYEESENES